jgi:hypothetical protein
MLRNGLIGVACVLGLDLGFALRPLLLDHDREPDRHFVEVEEKRFDGKGIRALYDSPDYPLSRRKPKAAATAKPAATAAPRR